MTEVLDPAVDNNDIAPEAGAATKPRSVPAIGDSLRALTVDLLTVSEAGKLLRVSDATVRNWIEADGIPYVKLPSPAGRKQYRIPLQGLLNSLEGTYDLRDALLEQNTRMRAADLPED